MLAGSIGSLFSASLAQLPHSKVRLLLRRPKAVSDLIAATPPSPLLATTDATSSSLPLVSLLVERNGFVRRTDGVEVELLPTPNEREQRERPNVTDSIPSNHQPGNPLSSKYPRLVRYDPIETLIVTTKAPQTIPALRAILPRLSSNSTVVLCQNGMGVLESLLDQYWPEDHSAMIETSNRGAQWGGRPNFICATTTHGVWRKGVGHFVHAGMGDIKFGIVPNQAARNDIASQFQGSPQDNPILDPTSLVFPQLSHLPLTSKTQTLHTAVSALLQLDELRTTWLPLPALQISQLQKLAVNASVNTLTAILGVNNGALVGSTKAKQLVRTVCEECAAVFAAHLAREEGRWDPPPPNQESTSNGDPEASSPVVSKRRSRTSPPPPHPPPPPLPISHPLSVDSLTDHTLRVIFKTSVNFSSTLVDIINTTTADSPSSPTRTEIDFINGYVAAMGRRYGIPTPVANTLGALVKLKEETLRTGVTDRVDKMRQALTSDVVEGEGKGKPALVRAEDAFRRQRRRTAVLGERARDRAQSM